MSRRQQILDAAAELFARRGFHGVSVDDLGAAVGISGPAIYKHFPSKDAMLAELLVSVSEGLLEEGRSRVGDDPDASLTRLVAFHTDFALGNKPLIVIQDRDWDSLPPADRDRVRELQRAYVDLWAEQVRGVRPSLDEAQSHAAAHAAFGLLNSTPRIAIPTAQLRPLLESMALAALRG